METFMVRVCRPAGDEHADGLRGTARQLRTGRSVTFPDAEALVAFLLAAAAEAVSTAVTAVAEPTEID